MGVLGTAVLGVVVYSVVVQGVGMNGMAVDYNGGHGVITHVVVVAHFIVIMLQGYRRYRIMNDFTL
jgi:hypothetical protein